MTVTFKECECCGKEYTPIQKTQKYCSTKCGAAIRTRRYYKKNKPSIQAKKEAKRKDTRDKITEYLGGELKCSHCGFTHTTTAPFDWHHLDPDEKEYNPANLIMGDWDKLKAELDKCVFLCKNCHALEHERIRNGLCT